MEPMARAAKQQKHKTEAVRIFSMLYFVWDHFQKYETKEMASSFGFVSVLDWKEWLSALGLGLGREGVLEADARQLK